MNSRIGTLGFDAIFDGCKFVIHSVFIETASEVPFPCPSASLPCLIAQLLSAAALGGGVFLINSDSLFLLVLSAAGLPHTTWQGELFSNCC
jgi:hypothetical protein